MNAVAQKVKEARLKAKMSEKELAKKCGVAASYIVEVETGKKVANEKTLEKMFSVLGANVDLNFGFALEEEKKAESATQNVKPKTVAAKPQSHQPVEPNEQWADALSGIVKKYPITEINTGKIAGYKEFPVIGKKVEGYAVEKVMFIKVADNELQGLRVMKNDVVMIHTMKDISGKGLYFIEMSGKKTIRVVQKEGNRFALSKGQKNDPPVLMDLNQVKVIGKCVKVEFEVQI